MGLSKIYAKTLRKENNIHAAWVPLGEVFSVGDFGKFHRGVFQRMGNIKDYLGIDFETRQGAPIKIDFKSKGMSLSRMQAGAEVPVFEVVDAEARLKLEFKRDNAILLRSNHVELEEMQSPQAVADQLKVHPKWRRSYKVVHGLYTASNATVLVAREAGTTFEFEGKAKVLKQFEKSWDFSAEMGFTASSELAIEYLGERGPIGLKLFKLSWFSGDIGLESAEAGEERLEELADWDADLPDDF